jgi:hypothetical protein
MRIDGILERMRTSIQWITDGSVRIKTGYGLLSIRTRL